MLDPDSRMIMLAGPPDGPRAPRAAAQDRPGRRRSFPRSRSPEAQRRAVARRLEAPVPRHRRRPASITTHRPDALLTEIERMKIAAADRPGRGRPGLGRHEASRESVADAAAVRRPSRPHRLRRRPRQEFLRVIGDAAASTSSGARSTTSRRTRRSSAAGEGGMWVADVLDEQEASPTSARTAGR
ncbi:MAG: hypothetical protein M0C28_06380 [Candidatus Moduliflexus flocculans]|nr:hypothetical protein [Candidatus Moduliflexus flocculans]